ncbi:hypothetical protein VTN77DRAFT_2846 [Rasamsonia byssochlamydoides]|uniref:uncharacterized protein n=1 Tax=Rasamsonia byssochlamydoides TaxID=89139 RepID=UPI003742C0AF
MKHLLPTSSLLRTNIVRAPFLSAATMATRAFDCDDGLFEFTRGRFLVNEAEQMARRRVRFNVNELASVAANSVGANRCVNIEKCPDDLYNKAYVLTMDDGTQLIGKVPNPNAGIPHYTTASEVATMDFKRWSEVKFTRFGSLYYAEDIGVCPGEPLSIEEVNSVLNSRFAVGPATGREWNDEGRQNIQCDRGPRTSILDYRKAVGLRERAAIKTLRHVPKQMAIVCGPGLLYQPTPAKKLAALEYYFQILEFLLPDDPSLTSGHLWHNDLHHENIFVNPEDPTEILGIIDWQSIQIAPLFDHCLDPSFINYDGTDVGDNLEPPKMPQNIDSLHGEEKTAAISHYLNKSVMGAWRRLVQGKNPSQYRAIRFQRPTSGHLLHLSRRIFELGEAHFCALLLDLQDEWQNRHLTESDPFSERQVAEIEADTKRADLGIEIMKTIEQRLGNLWPEKGVVEHERYEEVKALQGVKAELVAQYCVHPDEDTPIFEQFWPFDD